MSRAMQMRKTLAMAALATLAACSNKSADEQVNTPLEILLGAAVTAVVSRGDEEAPSAPPPTPQQAAATALRVNPGPLIQATMENDGRTQVLALTGENRGMRTYMTQSEQALILRGGMLVATRGLGHDLSVAEPGTDGLIRAGQSGRATRVMRYLTGDGLERPLQFACTTAPGPNANVMLETCEGHGTQFQNNYLVQGGQIPVSRQWIGPNLGYVTIQTLRP